MSGIRPTDFIFSPRRTGERALQWQDDALCAELGTEWFFPEKQGSSNATAKSICAACPVAAMCLEYAVNNEEQHGIWGGMTAREIRKIRQARDAA